MRLGRLRYRIVIEKPLEQQNEINENEPEWQTVATVWADKRELSGREFHAAQQLNAEASTRFIIRFRNDLETKMRIVYENRNYGIVHIKENNFRKALEILTTAPEKRD